MTETNNTQSQAGSIEAALDLAASVFDYNAVRANAAQSSADEDLLATLREQFDGVATPEQISDAVDRLMLKEQRTAVPEAVTTAAKARTQMSDAASRLPDEPGRAAQAIADAREGLSEFLDGVVTSARNAAVNGEQGELEPHLDRATYEARWIEQTAETKVLLNSGQGAQVRELLEEVDQNLRDFDEGGTPPGSDEMYGVYYDAITRAAIPYGEPPITVDEVAQQLRNAGVNVPTIDLDTISQRTGITALTPEFVTTALNSQQQTAPAGLEDVTKAQASIHQAIQSITVNGESAQTHLANASTALTHAINLLRPEERLDVERAQESVRRANANVDLITETAKDLDAEVTLYTLPDCVGCNATKRTLNKAGVEYEEINLQERPELVEMFKQQGLAQAPIVETKDGQRWAGYNPGKLREHGLDHRTRQQREGGTTAHGDRER
ncbi:glutaredoxin family protein [Brachybacterium muris]|uniref:glutaredoxin family protein n=1 Tax=Brachybacterium muris TaxID=219301 RepID=UPI00223B4E9F|nr:glutaredoxin family protein [Brachybacterium muris]MCT1654334.1 glutaredoxin family protein [Brachybacterium muris]